MILKSFRKLYTRYLEQHRSPVASQATHPFDVRAIAQTIQGALASAGLDTRSGVARSVTQTIEQALANAGLTAPVPAQRRRAETIDGVARDVTTSTKAAPDGALIEPDFPDQRAQGEFLTCSFRCDAGARNYKLYVPASYAQALEERVPLIVMLHGCTQDPDDFAAGTQMNALADRHGFVVAYPAQETRANGSRCWNWFRKQDQARGRGEPALIAGITRDVAALYRIDGRRIFVAGLSAGGAMALVVATTYPELYAAVGVHSGLPYACAQDVPSAFAAMSAGAVGGKALAREAAARRGDALPAIPMIVFHGDRDATVNASNAYAIVEQACAGRSAETPPLESTVNRGTTASGRAYTHTVLADGARRPVVEHWTLHGAGHAWSGGSADGSFTDPEGPDASAEMIRFFYSQPRGGSA